MPFQSVNLAEDDGQLLVLSTANTAYIIGLTRDGAVLHLYWGPKLCDPFQVADYPAIPVDRQVTGFEATTHQLLAEYPVRVGIQQFEPCLKPLFADDTGDLRLSCTNQIFEEATNVLRLTLQDEFYPVEVKLIYQLYPALDLITRQVEIVNSGNTSIILETILSGSVVLPAENGDFNLLHLSGAWASEAQLERTPVTPGRKVLESRLNYTGHAANPFFAVERVGLDGVGAEENRGDIWFGNLEWSGNWKTVVEQVRVPYPLTRLSAGLNDWDFSWELAPGQSFETPRLILGFTTGGWREMSLLLHRFQLQYLLPGSFADKLRPVIYNSWEAVEFELNERVQQELASKAARLGVEVFVVDDGWFGQRNNDRAGLGDWYVNPVKFPDGLKPLIQQVNALGMDFGIWLEPEMVNPDSDLYRAHPDWVYHFPNRSPLTGRNQLMLNLTLPPVQEWLWHWLDELLTTNNIRYVKWDFNRAISESGGNGVGRTKQRELWVRHITELYSLVKRLRAKHPQVLFEACSGGGGRTDPGILSHYDHIWVSDNTDPLDRLTIQRGYSLAYAPKTMYCWVTQTDRHNAGYSLRYRFHSAFMGSLGIGANLNSWSEAEFEEAGQLVQVYKRLRELIQHGSFYRLTSLVQAAAEQVVEYLSQDKRQGIVLAFNTEPYMWQTPVKVRLAGLDPQGHYELSGDIEKTVMSGRALMWRGVTPKWEHKGYYQSILIEFRLVSE